MTTRALLALVFCSFTFAAGCGSLDEEAPLQAPTEAASASADSIELQSFAASTTSCRGKKPKDLGRDCGCGNTVQCNGLCSGGAAIPAAFGLPCGCGGTVQCNALCGGGTPPPAQFGQPCGCGGTVDCNALCSGGSPPPADFGLDCGCGGTVQCNALCSVPCPLPR